MGDTTCSLDRDCAVTPEAANPTHEGKAMSIMPTEGEVKILCPGGIRAERLMLSLASPIEKLGPSRVVLAVIGIPASPAQHNIGVLVPPRRAGCVATGSGRGC